MNNYFVPLFLGLLCSAAYAKFDNFDEALQSATDNASAQNYSDARSDLMEALSLATTQDQKSFVHYTLGFVDTGEQKYPEARADFDLVINNTNFIPMMRYGARISIGDTYAAEKKFEQARVEYTQVLKDKQSNSSAQYRAQVAIGNSYFAEQDYESARKEYAKLSSFKEDPIAELAAALFIGKTFFAEKNYVQSRIEDSKVLAIQRKDLLPALQPVFRFYKEVAQLHIAQGYFLERDYKRAKEELEKVLQMPDVGARSKSEAERQLKAIADIEVHGEPAPPKGNK